MLKRVKQLLESSLAYCMGSVSVKFDGKEHRQRVLNVLQATTESWHLIMRLRLNLQSPDGD